MTYKPCYIIYINQQHIYFHSTLGVKLYFHIYVLFNGRNLSSKKTVWLNLPAQQMKGQKELRSNVCPYVLRIHWSSPNSRSEKVMTHWTHKSPGPHSTGRCWLWGSRSPHSPVGKGNRSRQNQRAACWLTESTRLDPGLSLHDFWHSCLTPPLLAEGLAGFLK